VRTNPLESEVGICKIDARWSKAIARRGARGSAWWPTSVRWMRQGVWAFTNKPQVRSLLRSADCLTSLVGADSGGAAGSPDARSL